MPPPPPGGAYQSVGSLAEWWPRVLGSLLDAVPIIVLEIIAVVLPVTILKILLYLIVLAYSIYLAVQLGQTGSTPGMRVIGLRCVSLETGQPIGGGMGFVRSLAHFLDAIICYIGFLFPLWDRQKQTLADKVIGTVVVTAPKQSWSFTPPAAA